MARSPEFFRQLSEQLLERLEEYARQPGRTGDEVHAWLRDQGVATSRAAVYRWLQDFRLADRTRRASETARAYLDAAREADPTAVTEASLRKFEELVFEHLAGADQDNAGGLLKIALAMKAGLGSRKDVIELKAMGRERMQALANQASKRAITAEDIQRVSKAVFG